MFRVVHVGMWDYRASLAFFARVRPESEWSVPKKPEFQKHDDQARDC